MTQRDFQDLEQATRLLMAIMERNQIRNEDVEHRQSQFKVITNDKIIPFNSSYFEKQKDVAQETLYNVERVKNESISFQEFLKEIKEMLLSIDVKGSVRLRKDGLYELRTKLGSVYGHSTDELKEKLEKKLENKIASGDWKKKDEKGNSKSWAKSIKTGKTKCPLFSDFFMNTYYPYKQQDVAPRTLKRIKYNFDFIQRQKFDYPLNKYTPKAITEFLLSIPETRKRQIMQGLLNNVFKYAVQMGLLKSPPTEHIAPMKHKTVKGTAFSFQEQRTFFTSLFADETITHDKKCYFAFVYLTGTRRNEALSLTVDDVQEVLHIPGTKTDGSDRYIPLFPLVEKLLKCLSTKNGRYFDFSEYGAQSAFTLHRGNHKIHDLRHTFGTIQCCVEKLDPKTVALYMGHSTLDTTLRIYTHPEQLDRATFLNGSLSEKEKNERLKAQYVEIQRIIEDFINTLTH